MPLLRWEAPLAGLGADQQRFTDHGVGLAVASRHTQVVPRSVSRTAVCRGTDLSRVAGTPRRLSWSTAARCISCRMSAAVDATFAAALRRLLNGEPPP